MKRGIKARGDAAWSRLTQLGFLLGLLVLWDLATTRWGVSKLLLPDPVSVWHQLLDVIRTGAFIADLEVTLGEMLAAFAIACSLGIGIGYLVSRSSYLIKVFEPLFSGIYSIPIILFLPLYILFFGLGPASKIALGATMGFFPIVLNTIAGFAYVEKAWVTAARAMGANDVQMLRYVLLPAALPVMLAGLRIGFTVGFLSVIGAETIVSLSGLGHRIVDLAENLDMARMFAYIVFVVVIAAVLNAILSALQGLGRWR